MKKDNGDIEATPTPFCVERNPGGKWGALFIGPDRGSYQNAEVLEAGKSTQFPFRLGETGTIRLRLNYWPGSKPNLNCKAQPKGAKRLASLPSLSTSATSLNSEALPGCSWWVHLSEFGFPSGPVEYSKVLHCNALARRPQRTSTEEATITMPTLMKPTVTRLSCQGCPLWPAAVIGERAAVPKAAASVVISQFT
jgi:hypothetical protein